MGKAARGQAVNWWNLGGRLCQRCLGGHCSWVQIKHFIAASAPFHNPPDLPAAFMEAFSLSPYTVRFSFPLVRNFRGSLERPFNLIFHHLLWLFFSPSNSECLSSLKRFRLLQRYCWSACQHLERGRQWRHVAGQRTRVSSSADVTGRRLRSFCPQSSPRRSDLMGVVLSCWRPPRYG